MPLSADVSQAIHDILEVSPNGGRVTLQDPPTKTIDGLEEIETPGATHSIRAILLPASAAFSGSMAVEDHDFGMLQPDELYLFVLDPLLDEDTDEERTVTPANENDGRGSSVHFRDHVYWVSAMAFGGEVDAGYRSYVVRREPKT